MALSDTQIACGHESASRQGGKHAHAAQGASARSSRGRNRLCSTDRARRLCEVIQPKWFADRFILKFCQFPGKHLQTVANGFHANLVKVPGSKIQESRQTFGIQDLVSNLGSRFLGSKKFFLESWILRLQTPLEKMFPKYMEA